jgi:hypothetical protein
MRDKVQELRDFGLKRMFGGHEKILDKTTNKNENAPSFRGVGGKFKLLVWSLLIYDASSSQF